MMELPDAPGSGPDPLAFREVFFVYETANDGDTLRYYGTPRIPIRQVLREVWPVFHQHGYDVRMEEQLGEVILIAEPIDVGINGIPWTNIVLLLATVGSTLFAGAHWYHLDPTSAEIIHAWPFTLAIMAVLGIHELGHYVMSRYHGVHASLPYFIPLPTLIGTMGAVIKMKGHIPSRRALFDIGVAGPLAGLVATIIITIIGLHLPPVDIPQEVIDHPDSVTVDLGFPLLLELIAMAVGQSLAPAPGQTVNPVVIAAWVGMFITFLNMIPVGQLDGGHILRSIAGERQELVASAVPIVLFGLAAYLYFLLGVSFHGVMIWALWGVLTAVFLAVGPAAPVVEEQLGRRRIAIGIITFILAMLCFHPVPVEIHM